MLLPAVTAGGGRFPTTTTTAASSLATLSDLMRDELTGLGSMLALRRHLELIAEGYQPFGTRPALLLIDVDGFDRVNALYGRAVGDEVLVTLASRLRLLVPGDQLTYRTGSDEFVALLEPIGMIDAVSAAGAVQTALGAAIEVAGTSVSVSVSVAVVMLGHRQRADSLLRDADVTMYRAKSEGGNRVDIYNWEIDGWSTARKKSTELLEKELQILRQQNRFLKDALTIDLVTGMANGLAFETDHVQAAAWRSRSGEPYSILRLSVDGVYEFGQEFRSTQGEEALTVLAHLIRDTIRQSDRAYVLDRGEYAVLLRGSPLKHAIMAADRIRGRVQNVRIAHPAGGDRILSVSTAAIEAGYRHAGPTEVLAELAELDELLQKAVTQGGGRVVWPV